ncbi:glyoxylase-like metal-dependent hydrolase (beta-lactamase superfamily II) [Pelomonas saccharophila]|uniref:Glyoxylase-like metal-dependent hydrolase (Beta-lactamase superfamily II) n=1 Tax=Roseateles saccharophilus TaxID=304 RepID=A0ABU1YHZ7_ROSSA|nr:MBL fold metallo-hydrolase [Roseateles saccharophilus]MDR7268472.1 glyoxylase-like metal-dependent hydrolase (beta-lactamase superfamily II) [Roseateles saccharophilus]
MLDFIEDLGHGIYAIDTGFQRPRFDAAYLMVENGHAAFIDTGTNHAVPRLLAALNALGLATDAVDWVIPTHVHLDHAGGVGLLMEALPRARALVHPRGLRHMVDPKALWLGALAVYGDEEMQRSYGKLVPVPAERAEATHDEQIVHLAGRPLRFIDSPGHAKHHHAIWDEKSRSWFTGDTFGLSYRAFDVDGRAWILPTSTPVQFEPEALKATVARLLAAEPVAMQVTHYGRIGGSVAEVQRLAAVMLEQVDEMVALAQLLKDAPNRHETLKGGLLAAYLARVQGHGYRGDMAAAADWLALDAELNAQGLEVMLDRPAR